MFLPIVLILGIVLFAMQLMICLKGKTLWRKLIPVILMTLGDLACWSIVWFSEHITLPYGASFAAYIYALILLMLLGFLILAWLVYGFINAIQKRK